MVKMLGPFHLGAVGSRDKHSRKSIAARVLREEIVRRCPGFSFRDCHAAGSIEFRFSLVRADLDRFGISVRDLGNRARVDIEGNNATSLLHAVGKLLRHIAFGEGIILPLLNLKLEASHQHRGHELSIYRYLDAWEPEDWERYTRELVLWGANWIWSTTSCCAPLKGCSEETATAWERHCAVQDIQAEIASSYGMSFGVHSFPNNISPDIVTPEMSWKGSYVCPSNPGARQLVLESRRMLFGRLRRIDAVFTSSHDPGGCPCQKCTPWVRTFILQPGPLQG
jgi:hypothetical protein